MRRIAFLFCLLLAGCGEELPAERPAQAPAKGPLALATLEAELPVALAGDVALAGRVRGRTLDVRAFALDGSGAAREAFRFQAPPGASPQFHLAASRERAAAIVTTQDDENTVQAFDGPPQGPWAPLGPSQTPRRGDFFPGWMEIDGGRLFLTELRGDYRRKRVIVREPGADPREVALPQSAFVYAFTGDMLAYAVPVPGQPSDDEPRRLVLRNWRTGAELARVRVPAGVEALDVRADGRVVLNEDGGGLLELRDGELRRLTRDGIGPRYAGDRIVFVRSGRREGDERLAVVEPDGRVRPFGVPTAELQGFDVDEQRVLWSGNGCLLVADVAAPAAVAPGPGPCPRSELFMDDLATPVVGRARRVPLTLRCVAAAPPGCAGTVRVELADGGPRSRDSSSARFVIPAGRTKRLAPRLTGRAYRAARREARGGMGGAFLVVHAVAVDPEGRRSRLSDGYAIEFPR